jgi:hypothetical protein
MRLVHGLEHIVGQLAKYIDLEQTGSDRVLQFWIG